MKTCVSEGICEFQRPLIKSVPSAAPDYIALAEKWEKCAASLTNEIQAYVGTRIKEGEVEAWRDAFKHSAKELKMQAHGITEQDIADTMPEPVRG